MVDEKKPESPQDKHIKHLHHNADLFKDQFHIRTIKATNLYQEELWTWQGGKYNREGEATIHSLVLDSHTTYTKGDFNNIIEFIKAQTRVSRDEIEPPQHLCNLKNGIINVDKINSNDFFMPRKETDYQYNFISMIPVEYNKDAKCPIIDKIISDILENDPYRINLLYQFLGLCLFPTYEYKYATIFVGDRDTAKSTIINMIIQFLGNKNISSVSIQQMDVEKNRFAAVDLVDKLANIKDEMPKIELKNIESFKALLGSSPVRVEHKGKDGFNIVNNAKMLFAANELSSIDETIASSFYGKVVVIEFMRCFTDGKNKKSINDPKKKTMKYSNEEMSGLLNHAIEGQRMLVNNNGFTQNELEVPTIWNRHLTGGYRLEPFITTQITITGDPKDDMPYQSLYQHYADYCASKHEKPISINGFNKFISTRSGIKFKRITLFYDPTTQKQVMGDGWSGLILIKENKINICKGCGAILSANEKCRCPKPENKIPEPEQE